MKKILGTIVFVIVFFAMTGAIKRMDLDLKLPSQVMLELQSIDNAIVADDDRILVDQATSGSVITTVTSFLAQPDVCRAVSVLPGGTTADVPAGGIDFTGTNFFGATITETLTLAANASTLKSGLQAFCSVTSIVFPIQDGAAATYDVGVIDVLGLKRCMDDAGSVAWASFDGAFETTDPTIVANATVIDKNTINPNGTLDGAKDLKVYFVQNFRCKP